MPGTRPRVVQQDACALVVGNSYVLLPGARDKYAVEYINSLSLENALQDFWVTTREGRSKG
jgi:hypothetical protein